MKKIILIGLALLIALSTCGYLYLCSLTPVYDGSQNLSCIKTPVKVLRDKWGIPSIKASNTIDLYKAFGFIHAQDRLFQMDGMRRLSNGQLAEVLGEKALPLDLKMRTLRIARHFQDLKKTNPSYFQGQWMKYYEAYCEGINEYLKSGPLPLEFKILGYEPKPFTPQDLLPIAGYMALTFAHGIKVDSLATSIAASLDKKMVEELIQGYPKLGPTILSSHRLPGSGLELWSTFLNELQDQSGYFYGSNSWIIAPSRSQTGSTILVNDPHIRYVNPSIWYEAHLESPDYQIHGFFLAGFPFPLLGHNQNHAYGLTMLENDDMDLFEETMSEDGKSSLHDNQWIPTREELELIAVKGKQKPQELIVRSTPNGPIISDFLPAKLEGKSISLSWLFYEPDNQIFEAFFGMASAKSEQDFESSIAKIASPGLNISYVDKAGNIAWWAAGKLPINSVKAPSKVVLNGADPESSISGFHPFSENPRMKNPKQGFIYTANNKPVNSDMVRGYFMPADRAERILEMLASQEKLSLEFMERMQTDSVLMTAKLAIPLILQATNGKALDAREKTGLEILGQWDGSHEISQVGAAIFQEWEYQLLGVLLDPILKNHSKPFKELALAKHFITALLRSKTSNFLTSQNMSFDEAVLEAYKRACASLTKKLGTSVEQWSWGRIHTLELPHALGKVWPLNLIFNLGPYPAPGVKESINSVGSTFSNRRFQATSGPSTRRIITFHDIDQSRAIIPTGNSGNRLSKHYDDQVQPYLENQYRLIPFTWSAIEKAAVYHMDLLPH